MRLTVVGNERLQEMMSIMASERGGQVFATDERYVAFDDMTANLTFRISDFASTTES